MAIFNKIWSHSKKALLSSKSHFSKKPDVINTARGYILSRETFQSLKIDNLNIWCRLFVFNLRVSHSSCRFIKWSYCEQAKSLVTCLRHVTLRTTSKRATSAQISQICDAWGQKHRLNHHNKPKSVLYNAIKLRISTISLTVNEGHMYHSGLYNIHSWRLFLYLVIYIPLYSSFNTWIASSWVNQSAVK